MKKIFYLLFAIALTSTSVFAQTSADSVLRSKRGYVILPEANEWALGVAANPFFQYIGNVFNGTSFQDGPTVDYASNPANNIAVFGKKMIDAHTAYRARFNVSSGLTINKAAISRDEVSPDLSAPAFVDDWQKSSSTTVVLTGGIEKRRGKSRVQGIYGGELVVGFTSAKTVYQYGNPFSTDFNTPTTNNFGNNILGGGARKTQEKFGNTLLVGARGFVGVEYFVAPKVSIGGEFGYMLAFRTTGKSYITSESWNGATNATQSVKTEYYSNNGLSSIGIGVDNLNGSINLLFYF